MAKRSNIRICLDVFSVVCVVALPISLWWMALWPLIDISFSILPLQAFVALIALPPFFFGTVWLEVSYNDFIKSKFPAYRRWHLWNIYFFLGVFVPLVLMKFIK